MAKVERGMVVWIRRGYNPKTDWHTAEVITDTAVLAKNPHLYLGDVQIGDLATYKIPSWLSRIFTKKAYPEVTEISRKGQVIWPEKW